MTTAEAIAHLRLARSDPGSAGLFYATKESHDYFDAALDSLEAEIERLQALHLERTKSHDAALRGKLAEIERLTALHQAAK
jgi:hypothetical protein